MLENEYQSGVFVGRACVPGAPHPCIVTVRGDDVFDITSPTTPTMRDLCELADPVGYARGADGVTVGRRSEVLANSHRVGRDSQKAYLLSPVDLQAVKACGVTFVVSLLERVIEEQAQGDLTRAAELRGEITDLLGTDLSRIVPGSSGALAVRTRLIEKGIWSQYLEVGIGPDAEVFTKSHPMATVGYGADIGIHPASEWNNPEPEMVLIVTTEGRAVGATLGNDVNLRDIEGRSALLLGKAKDNNASAALGPFIRLFDQDFTFADVENMELSLRVEGEDGFVLEGQSSMRKISRPPKALIEAAMGAHHQYPDGLVLYLGTMFAPVQDRDGEGKGFTHKSGDRVQIASPFLGTLENRVRKTNECDPWTYGTSQLFRDLARAHLI